jgi:cellulose synthase/poly-beta-1,6-N-acetylglucosamine synthase-like glycosyltransferase
LIRTPHRGKSININAAIARAQGQLFAIVDGDSEISQNALIEMKKGLEQEKVAGVSCPIFVKNRTTHIIPWLHIEILHGTLMRLIMSKVGANICTSGQFCMFRTEALREIGGFNTQTLSEDMDISIRLIRKGYKVGFVEGARSWTNMPHSLKWLIGQRFRWCRGNLNVMLSHQKLNSSWIDLYTLPLIFFGFFQAVIMGSISLTKMTTGYWQYFASHGEYLSMPAAKFLLDWISVAGLINWSFKFAIGEIPFTPVTMCGVMAGLLTYPLYIYAIWRFERRFDLYHVVPLCFMAPYWWTISLVQIASAGVFFRPNQRNIWAKNDRSLSVAKSTLAAREELEKSMAPGERQLVS